MSDRSPACWRTAAAGPIPVKSARTHLKGRDHSEGHQPAHPRTAISTREAQSGGPPPTHTAPARRNHPPRSPPLTPPPAAYPDTTATTTHPRPPEPRAHYTKPLHHLTRPLQHRLASCACATGCNTSRRQAQHPRHRHQAVSDEWAAGEPWRQTSAERAEADIERLREEIERRRELSRHHAELVAEKRRLQAELGELVRTEAVLEFEAEKERRNLAAEVRRLQRKADRARLTRTDGGGRRATRAAHVKVDSDAWAALKRHALEQRQSVAEVLTELVVDHVSTDEATTARRRRSPGEGDPRPERRIVRLACDDETWHQLRLMADTANTPVGRYLGELIETAAHQHGWRASGSLADN